MRIDKLKLTRFGSFTNKSIDFGAAPNLKKNSGNDELDLHLVFGPNEAGKSTIRSAVESFLYGIPLRTGYDFLHASKTLQIEAQISSADRSHELVRIKRNAKSLLGADGQAVGDELLKPMLSGVDRDAYVNMFSMDEDCLERGGNSILESEGELGELLFSSTSGLAALGSELAKVRTETESFYRARSQKVGLKQKTARLKELKDQIKALDMPASQFVARKKEAKEALKAYEGLVAEREQKEAEKIRLKALLDCVSPWREFVAQEEKLDAIETLPAVPNAWIDQAQQLASQSARLDTRIEQLQLRINDLQSQIDAIQIEQPLIEAAPQINRLVDDDIEARFRTADSAQGVQATVTGLAEQIQRSVSTLAAPAGTKARDLPLPVGRVGLLKALIERRLVLDANLQSATEETSRAGAAFDTASKAHGDIVAGADLSELARSVASVREQDLDRDLKRLSTEVRAQQSTLEQALLMLEPWKGTAQALRALEIPSTSELAALEAQEQANVQTQAALGSDRERLTADLARLQTEHDTRRRAGSLVDDAVAAQAKEERDALWHAHQRLVDAEPIDAKALRASADKFDSALKQHDAVVTARFGQSADLAQLRGLEVQLGRTKADLEQLDRRTDLLGAAQSKTTLELAALGKRLGLAGAIATLELGPWLVRRAEALREAEKLNHLQIETEQQQERSNGALKQIQAAFKAAGLSLPSGDLLTHLQAADTAVNHWREVEQAATEALRVLEETTHELEERNKRMALTTAAMAQWNKEWREALSGTWLSVNNQAPGAEAAELVTPTPTPTPTPIEVAEVLRALDELSVLLTKHNDAQIALASIEDSRVRYVQEVTQIAESLEVPVDLDNPLSTADVLRKQLVDAQTNARRKAELAEEVKQLKSQLSSEQALKQQSQSVFAEMSAIFPAKDFDGLLVLMRRGEERERALATRAATQSQLGNLLGLADFDEAKQLLQTRLSDSSAIDALKVEHAAAVADSTNLNDEVARLFHAWRGAEEALSAIGDDGEVARLNEQYRVLLLDIEADTQRYIALSAGTLAVERALRAYVDTHRSSLLARASSAFATITRGAFTGLDAMPGIAGQSKEELVGTRVDGSTTSATQMSRGSRFQLYLSLRIAGYHEFVAQREPLPFFADDILETFDDDRSAETFSLMADMAKHGQVIYLTHHQHLCEIARQVTNGRVKIHELPARSLHDLTHA